MIPDTPKWHVAYTAPRSEKKAYEILIKNGVETFLPLHKELRQWSDRKKWVELPLFPSYIFVKIYKSQYFDVLNTQKIVRFIFFEGKPAIVRDSQIDAVRQLVENRIKMETTNEDIKPGDLVKIMGGPFAGFDAEMIENKGTKKILIRIEQIGQSLLVNIPLTYVKVLKN